MISNLAQFLTWTMTMGLAWHGLAAEGGGGSSGPAQPGLRKSEVLVQDAPFAFAHASTIVESRSGALLAAWAGGSAERALDVGIWLTRSEGGAWSAPVEIFKGYEIREARRYPCWNPVLFQPKFGPLLLWYKVGPSPEGWWAYITTSDNDGLTWSEPKRLPKNQWGPVRNKPVELPEAWLLCGSSTESAGWHVHIEWMRSPGRDYGRTPDLNSALEFNAIQPTLLVHPSGDVQILCRTKQERIIESWSTDAGKHWTPFKRTPLPNPNSAIDAVMLQDGRALLVYNHSTDDRGVLNVALSKDGKTWEAALVLENSSGNESSYPAVIQTKDGLVHAVYSWKRQRIKHAIIDPAELRSRPMIDGEWP